MGLPKQRMRLHVSRRNGSENIPLFLRKRGRPFPAWIQRTTLVRWSLRQAAARLPPLLPQPVPQGPLWTLPANREAIMPLRTRAGRKTMWSSAHQLWDRLRDASEAVVGGYRAACK